MVRFYIFIVVLLMLSHVALCQQDSCLVYQKTDEIDSTICLVMFFNDSGQVIREEYSDYLIDPTTTFLLSSVYYYYDGKTLKQKKSIFANNDSIIENYFYENTKLIKTEEFSYNEEDISFWSKIENWNRVIISAHYSGDTLVEMTATDFYDKILWNETYSYSNSTATIIRTDYSYQKMNPFFVTKIINYFDEQMNIVKTEYYDNNSRIYKIITNFYSNNSDSEITIIDEILSGKTLTRYYFCQRNYKEYIYLDLIRHY